MDKKITQLTELVTPGNADLIPIVHDPIGIPQSMYITPANLQAALSTRMANLEAGWVLVASSATYISETSFRISGNVVDKFPVGGKIKLINGSTKYFYVFSSSYASSYTTVTVFTSTSYELTNTAISSISISFVHPLDFPSLLNYSPALGAYTGTVASATTSGAFAIIGRTLFLYLSISIITNGTAAGVLYATVPKPSATVTIINGRENTATGVMLQGILAGSSTVGIMRYDGAYPGGNNYQIYLSGGYPI